MSITEREFILLGGSLYVAQRVEFALYGLAAHAVHLASAKDAKHFRKLTPDSFLEGDPDLKATLGLLVKTFGDALLLRTDELDEFVDNRNLIVHNYFRAFHTDLRDKPRRTDGEEFLTGFIERASRWEEILRGCVTQFQIAAAANAGRSSELSLTPEDEKRAAAYRQQAGRHLGQRPRCSDVPPE
jgi:hypothetical protein